MASRVILKTYTPNRFNEILNATKNKKEILERGALFL